MTLKIESRIIEETIWKCFLQLRNAFRNGNHRAAKNKEMEIKFSTLLMRGIVIERLEFVSKQYPIWDGFDSIQRRRRRALFSYQGHFLSSTGKK